MWKIMRDRLSQFFAFVLFESQDFCLLEMINFRPQIAMVKAIWVHKKKAYKIGKMESPKKNIFQVTSVGCPRYLSLTDLRDKREDIFPIWKFHKNFLKLNFFLKI